MLIRMLGLAFDMDFDMLFLRTGTGGAVGSDWRPHCLGLVLEIGVIVDLTADCGDDAGGTSHRTSFAQSSSV